MYKNLYHKHIGNIGIFGNSRMTTHYFHHIKELLELQKYNHKPLYELDMIIKEQDYPDFEFGSISNDGVLDGGRFMSDYYGHPLGYDSFYILFVPELCEYEDKIEWFLNP